MKLINIALAASLILGSTAVFADMSHDQHQMQTSSQSEQLIQSQGVVKAVDLTNKKVTISHEPIAELGWPAMTMRFTAEDKALIENLKENDKVNFTFVQQGNLSILRSISVTQ